jgi:Uma2 family endonuclease
VSCAASAAAPKLETSASIERRDMNASIVKQPLATRLSAAELRSRWQQMLDDPLLAAIPFKVELNEKGAIEVSPANTRHGMLQAFVARELGRLLPHGTTFTECPVETEIGVRVPDVAWASPAFVARHGLPASFARSPELCVEVVSPSNSAIEIREKTAAYLAAGALEVWLVAADGTIEMFDTHGRLDASSFGIAPTLPR